MVDMSCQCYADVRTNAELIAVCSATPMQLSLPEF